MAITWFNRWRRNVGEHKKSMKLNLKFIAINKGFRDHSLLVSGALDNFLCSATFFFYRLNRVIAIFCCFKSNVNYTCSCFSFITITMYWSSMTLFHILHLSAIEFAEYLSSEVLLICLLSMTTVEIYHLSSFERFMFTFILTPMTYKSSSFNLSTHTSN